MKISAFDSLPTNGLTISDEHALTATLAAKNLAQNASQRTCEFIENWQCGSCIPVTVPSTQKQLRRAVSIRENKERNRSLFGAPAVRTIKTPGKSPKTSGNRGNR